MMIVRATTGHSAQYVNSPSTGACHMPSLNLAVAAMIAMLSLGTAVALYSTMPDAVYTVRDASVQSAHAKPSIVLVHGAFADASSWTRVISLLEGDGYTVVAVQNPLTSFAEDVATTKRVIDAQAGPVVVVGHSYGGAVITGAAAGNENVRALVYIAAFAPDAGETVSAFNVQYPSALGAALRPDAAGFLYIDRSMFHDVFAKDVAFAETRVMAATQKPINGGAFAGTVAQPAWRTIPSWYLIALEDQAINPELERFYARRMGATTREIHASHVPFISHPSDVSHLIEQAATAP
jgi:pimeloyl-ACP methyl ester carboxylesterase